MPLLASLRIENLLVLPFDTAKFGGRSNLSLLNCYPCCRLNPSCLTVQIRTTGCSAIVVYGRQRLGGRTNFGDLFRLMMLFENHRSPPCHFTIKPALIATISCHYEQWLWQQHHQPHHVIQAEITETRDHPCNTVRFVTGMDAPIF